MQTKKDRDVVTKRNASVTLACDEFTSPVGRDNFEVAIFYPILHPKTLSILTEFIFIVIFIFFVMSAIEPFHTTPPENCSGKFCVAFDPLDGSSNIDCNVSTGTIFAVYNKRSSVGGNINDVLRAGTDIKVGDWVGGPGGISVQHTYTTQMCCSC